MSMGRMMAREQRLVKRMGLRPHVILVAVNGAGFDLNNGNVNTLFSQLNGAANDARYEGERKVA